MPMCIVNTSKVNQSTSESGKMDADKGACNEIAGAFVESELGSYASTSASSN